MSAQIMTIQQVKERHGLKALHYTIGLNPKAPEVQVAEEINRIIEQLVEEDGIGGA